MCHIIKEQKKANFDLQTTLHKMFYPCKSCLLFLIEANWHNLPVRDGAWRSSVVAQALAGLVMLFSAINCEP